jgi:hypothetical protein
VRAPQGDFPEGPRIVYADIPSSDLDKPGQNALTVRVSMTGLRAENASYNPPAVKATFDVRQSETTAKISSMPVSLSIAPSLENAFKVKCDDILPNVPVIGPPDQITFLLQENTDKPLAVLRILREDTVTAGTAGTGRKRLEFQFPKGAEGVSVDPEFAARPFEYTLIPQPAGQ